jgi:hypothetical protein
MMMYIDGMEDVPSGALTAVKFASPLLSVCWADMPVSDVGGGCVDLRDHRWLAGVAIELGANRHLGQDAL